jgi:hypothetical protein
MNINKIRREATRVALLSTHQFVFELENWKKEIEMYEKFYTQMSRQEWLKTFGEHYHRAIELLLVKIHVCEAVHKGDPMCTPTP